MIDKRRHVASQGEDNGNAKLTDTEAVFVFLNYRARCRTFGMKALADRFGVTRRIIWLIVKGKAYRKAAAMARAEYEVLP